MGEKDYEAFDDWINQSNLSLEELRELQQNPSKVEQIGQMIMKENDESTTLNNNSSKNISVRPTEKPKTLTLSNGHSILPSDNENFKRTDNGGFANLVIIALLAGFMIGTILTTIYIYNNLGQVQFYL